MTEISKTSELEKLKDASLSMASECNLIEITDDNTLAIANHRLSKANDYLNQIEKTRKVLKQPSLDEGTRIDSIAKQISAPLKEAVEIGKNKILQYDKKKQIEAQKEQQRIYAIKDRINRYSIDAVSAMNNATTDAELVTVYNKYVKTFPSDWDEFSEAANNMRVSLRDYASQRRIAINNPAETDEIVKDVIQEQIEVIVDINTDVKTEKTKGLITKWDFELHDLTQVPIEWLMLNEKAVDEWKKNNKDKLNDGEIINGVKFFIETKVRIR